MSDSIGELVCRVSDKEFKILCHVSLTINVDSKNVDSKNVDDITRVSDCLDVGSAYQLISVSREEDHLEIRFAGPV